MGRFFKDLDLYKAIILVSWLLLPAVGGWAYFLQGQLEEGRTALFNATKRGGELEEIGKYQKAVEEQNRSSAVLNENAENFSTYFERSIIDSTAESSRDSMKHTDYSITKKTEQNVGRDAVDVLVDIRFDKGVMPLRRNFLLAVLFNSERRSPTWKLRKLHIKNPNITRRGGGRTKAAPPVETPDEWQVQEILFASRKPRK